MVALRRPDEGHLGPRGLAQDARAPDLDGTPEDRLPLEGPVDHRAEGVVPHDDEHESRPGGRVVRPAHELREVVEEGGFDLVVGGERRRRRLRSAGEEGTEHEVAGPGSESHSRENVHL